MKIASIVLLQILLDLNVWLQSTMFLGCSDLWCKQLFFVSWFDKHFRSQFAIYFRYCGVEKIAFCFRHFLFKFDAKMTFTNFFAKFSFSPILNQKDVIYKTQINISEVCQKWKYRLFLKPSYKNICIARAHLVPLAQPFLVSKITFKELKITLRY